MEEPCQIPLPAPQKTQECNQPDAQSVKFYRASGGFFNKKKHTGEKKKKREAGLLPSKRYLEDTLIRALCGLCLDPDF